MTTTDHPAQIRALRAEVLAAIEQRDLLATAARRALIAEWEAGRICRAGCADALRMWGRQPPPGDLTVLACGQLSYARMHADDDEAREEALHHVPDELHPLLPTVSVWPTRVVEVGPVAGEDADRDVRPYRITVQVSLRAQVKATSTTAAIDGAAAMVNSRLPELATMNITLTGLTWTVHDGPDDLIHPPDTDTTHAAEQPPDIGDDLTAATAAHDAATTALADLRRTIRRRAIRALVDDELGGLYEQTAERVERFLTDLGLAGLPRTHHVTVAAHLRLRIRAATGQEAYDAVGDRMRARSAGAVPAGSWTADGWATAESQVLDDGRRLICWRREYELWLRGQPGPQDAAAAGEAFARTSLANTLAGIDHDLVEVTATCAGYGIDPHLDPDTD